MLRSRTGASNSFGGVYLHLPLRIMMLHLLCHAIGKLEARHAPCSPGKPRLTSRSIQLSYVKQHGMNELNVSQKQAPPSHCPHQGPAGRPSRTTSDS